MTSITVRIPEELKKELEALGVEVSQVTRSALEAEIRRIRREKAREAAEKLGKFLAEVPDKEILKAIHEGRDER